MAIADGDSGHSHINGDASKVAGGKGESNGCPVGDVPKSAKVFLTVGGTLPKVPGLVEPCHAPPERLHMVDDARSLVLIVGIFPVALSVFVHG